MSTHSRFLTLISGFGNQSKFWDSPKPLLSNTEDFTMANRKRNIQLKIWVTEEERKLIEYKMSLVPTSRSGRTYGKWRLTVRHSHRHNKHKGNEQGTARHRPQHQPDCKARQFHQRYIPGRYSRAPGKAR